MSRVLNFILLGVITTVVSACSTTQETQPTNEVSQLEKGKAYKVPSKKEEFFYSDNDSKYRMQTTWDGILRARITAVNVEEGNAFTGKGNEFIDVQNLIRDAFRAENICENGEHPGILDFGYVYDPNNAVWAARVRCSEFFQKNASQ
jgi:hypothetical protein